MSESTHTYITASVPGEVEVRRFLFEDCVKSALPEQFDSFKFTGYGCGHSGRLIAGYAFEGRTASRRKYLTQAGPFVGDMVKNPAEAAATLLQEVRDAVAELLEKDAA